MLRRGFDRVRSFKSEHDAQIAEAQNRGGKIYEDFATDVLERLKKHGARMHACPPISAKCHIDGRFSVRFGGTVGGIYWERGISIDFPLLHQRQYLGDPVAVSETILKLAERYREDAVGIVRASS